MQPKRGSTAQYCPFYACMRIFVHRHLTCLCSSKTADMYVHDAPSLLALCIASACRAKQAARCSLWPGASVQRAQQRLCTRSVIRRWHAQACVMRLRPFAARAVCLLHASMQHAGCLYLGVLQPRACRHAPRLCIRHYAKGLQGLVFTFCYLLTAAAVACQPAWQLQQLLAAAWCCLAASQTLRGC